MSDNKKTRLFSSKLSETLKILIPIWGVICILVFIFFPGRIGSVQGTAIEGTVFLTSKLGNINYIKLVSGLLLSFFQILIIFFIYTFTGTTLILPTRKIEKSYDPREPFTYVLLVGSSFISGHLIFSVIFFTLAYFKNLTPFTVTWALLAGVIFTFQKGNRCFIQPILGRKINLISKHEASVYSTIQMLSILLLFTSLLLSTARLSYDSVYLYFSDPKASALTESLHFFQGNIFAISSFQTAIHYAAIISIFGDQAARMYSWIGGCLIIVFSLGIAKTIGLSNKAISFLSIMILTTTAITDLLGDGKVELISTAIVLSSIYWMLDDKRKYNKFIAGVFIGLAMSSRIYNVFLLGLFTTFFYLIRAYRDKKDMDVGKNLIKTISVLGIGALTPLILNLIANWAVFGNAMAMLSDANGLPTEKWQWAIDPQYLWAVRLFLPFSATFLNTPQSLGSLSPLFLGFLPTLFFRSIRKRPKVSKELIDLSIAAIITLLLWVWIFFTVMEIRYIFFLWILLFIPISDVTVYAFENDGFPFKKLMFSFINIFLIFCILRIAYISLDTYAPLDSQGNPQCDDHLFCDYLKSINKEAPQGARVLTLTAFRYYLRSDLLVCSTVADEYQQLREASIQGNNRFWEEVYRQGYSYIAYENNYSVRHLYIDLVPNPNDLPNWIKLEPIYGAPNDPTVAYKVLITSTPPVSLISTCSQENGLWLVNKLNSN